MLGADASITARQFCDGALWSILAEELLICQRGVVKLLVVVLGAVEELSESWMILVIVL